MLEYYRTAGADPGRIDRGTFGGQFVSGQRTEIQQPIGIAPAGGSDFSFRILDASEPGVAKVLIQDGAIFAPNNADSVYPAGMPSEDTYQLDVNDNDEIWVELDWTRGATPTLNSASINHGPTTPDDLGDQTYITIGYVHVVFSGTRPKVLPSNTYCGDIIVVLPPAQDEDPSTVDYVVLVRDTDDGTLHWLPSCKGTCSS